MSLIALLFFACTKDLVDDVIQNPNAIVQNSNTLIQDEAIDLFAIAIAKSMVYEEFRTLIRNETNKLFDFDYDVLYRFISKNKVLIKELGEIEIESFLLSSIENEISKSSFKSKKKFIDCIKSISNLNICLPFQYATWKPNDYTPKVAILDDKFIDKYEKVKCYDSSGSLNYLYKKDGQPELPIVTVGVSERVDKDGKISVDPYGFVLDEGDRTLTADEAFSLASSNLKSGKVWVPISIVEIVDDSYFDSFHKNETTIIHKNGNIKSDEFRIKDNSIKSSNVVTSLVKPAITTLQPCTDFGYAAYMEWSSVEGATHYEIQRRISQTGSWGDIGETVGETRSLVDQGLTSGGAGYYYRVRAINVNTGQNSDYSDLNYLTACWRKGLANECIDKIKLSSGCANNIGFLESYIELFVQTVLYNYQDKQIDYPKTPLGSFFMGGWLNGLTFYPGEMLFNWDMRKHCQNYYFYLWESDGGGSITITAGAKAFVGNGVGSGLEGSFSVAYTVKSLDDYVGFLNVYSFTPTYNEHSIQPPVGSASVIISSN